MFKFSIMSEVTGKYYERRIRSFFDFIEFSPDQDIGQRCNSFAEKGSQRCQLGVKQNIILSSIPKGTNGERRNSGSHFN